MVYYLSGIMAAISHKSNFAWFQAKLHINFLCVQLRANLRVQGDT